MTLRLVLLIVLLALSAFAAEGEKGVCPPDLLNAAAFHQTVLNAAEEVTKSSTVDAPKGVEPSQAFDLAAHLCHIVPGQAYRLYGEGECKLDPSGKKGVVRFPYRLFYRRGVTVEALYAEPWKEGSDGILQVTFEKGEKGWEATARRESLSLGSPGHKGPPVPKEGLRP